MNYIIDFAKNFIELFVDMSFYIMLGLLLVGILNTFVKREKILNHLGKDDFSSVVKASAVGVPLPLCSCGVVPTAVELKKGGASNGAVISFLISTPQTGVDSIFATYSIMGAVMAIFRPIAAFCSGIIGGAIVNIFAKHQHKNLDNVQIHSCCSHEEVKEEVHCCSHEEVKEEAHCCCSHKEEHHHEEAHCGCCSHEEVPANSNKFLRVFKYAFGSFLDEIAIHFIVGMVFATIITTFVPADFFVNLGLHQGVLAMLAMVVIGLPMYICSTSSIPIVLSLITKGLSFGSGFVFLFTGPVTNIASLLVLGKALGKKVTALYIGCVVVCSIGFGLLLDFMITEFNLNILSNAHGHTGHMAGIITNIVAIIFALLLLKAVAKRFHARFLAK